MSDARKAMKWSPYLIYWRNCIFHCINDCNDSLHSNFLGSLTLICVDTLVAMSTRFQVFAFFMRFRRLPFLNYHFTLIPPQRLDQINITAATTVMNMMLDIRGKEEVVSIDIHI